MDGVVYTYYYMGDKLMRMTVGTDKVLDFTYDQNGQPYSVTYNGTKAYYVLNQQGDVVRIVTAGGASRGVYYYDAWGNILYNTDNDFLNYNPLRYRGYVYDTESQLYYCQSRYYDPALGRFLNADSFASTGQGLLGNNMFAYCLNNPINMIDHQGYLTVSIGVGIGGYLLIGGSDSISIAFDDAGNIEIQRSYSSPKKRETTSMGLFNFGGSGFVQITNKADVSELRDVSTYLGFSDPSPIGFDFVIDAPVAESDGDLIGVQFSKGAGIPGVDIHVAQTFTETLYRFTWRDVFKWVKNRFES